MMKDKLHKYFNLEAHKQDKSLCVQLFVNLFCLFFICFSVYVSLQSVLLDRSLWHDEAALAYSLITRSVGQLTSEIFEFDQSAPVLYIYIVKIITIIFGTSEISLRIFSFFSYLITLGAAYFLATRVLKIKLPLTPVALISVLFIIVSFSNQFKPYMTDCAVVLSIIIIYYYYTLQKIRMQWVTLIYALFIWLSNPSCFFIGSILLIEFVEGIRNRDASKIKFAVICGIVIFISFIIYFFYWLKLVSESPFMLDFWKYHDFPLIPTGRNDLRLIEILITSFTNRMGTYHLLIFFVAFIGMFINLFIEKNRYIHVIYGGIIIGLFASMLGKYPFVDRLFLFLYPLLILMFFYFFNKLYSKNLTQTLIVATISLLIIYETSKLRDYSYTENVYRPQLEANFAIDYIKENIHEGDKLYVYYYCYTPFLYRNNFDSISIGNFKNNVIKGQDPDYMKKHNLSDFQRIHDNAPIYVYASFSYREKEIKPLLDSLRVRGNLELVHDKYETNVYYYTTNSQDSITTEKPHHPDKASPN